MKVLVIYHAGAMRNALEIYGAMAAEQGIELTAAVPERCAVDRVYSPSGWLEVEKERDSDGYRLFPLPLVDPNGYGSGYEVGALRKLVQHHKADIVHVWDEPFSYCLHQVSWLRAVFARRSKVLFYGFHNTPFKWGLLGRVLARSTWTQVAGGAAANSEALSRLRQAGFPRSRPTERIFWGISTQLFKPVDKLALRKVLRLEYEHIVGYVGRLVPEKGLSWLLAAMKRLPRSVHCVIIGNGPLRGEIELWSELPSLVGRVHLLDAQPVGDLPSYLNCMDVLAVPSLTTALWKEQYGRVIPEAMACGVPVVGSDSGAIPEVVGRAGLIVSEGDVGALAGALQTAIFDEARCDLIEQGLKRAHNELSVQAMSQCLLDFYRRILRA